VARRANVPSAVLERDPKRSPWGHHRSIRPKFKATTREQWQEAAEAWDRWGPTLEDWLGPATEAMLDGARVRAGARVLDIAAGAGGQTLAAARSAGLENVDTRELDGESLAGIEDESVDAVISRLGIMYFPDQPGALAEMRRVLRPGGRLAAVVWSTPENGRFWSLAVGIIRRRAELPPPLPGQPGPFSLDSRSPTAPCTKCSQASTRPVAKRPGTRLERRSPSSTARMAFSRRASCWWAPPRGNTKMQRTETERASLEAVDDVSTITALGG
jgi:hypothetical protein